MDVRASKAAGEQVRGVIDAIRFPSDPEDLILEDNDVAIFLRSDSVDFIADGSASLFDEAKGLFSITSIRRGFAGGGFDGSQSLPKQMAMAAGIGGAELIPDTAELFLGFTSTQKAGLGPPRDRELRDAARIHRPVSRRLLPRRNGDAPLASLRGRRGVVPELRLPRARGDDVQAGARRGGGDADGSPGRRGRGRRQGRRAGRRAIRRRRAQLGHAAGLPPAGRRDRERRNPLSEGHGGAAAGGLQHARQPVLLERTARRGPPGRPAGGGPPFRRLHADERRLPSHAARDGRGPPGRHEHPAPSALARAGLQLDPADDAPAELPRPAAAQPLLPALRAALASRKRLWRRRTTWAGPS